MCAGDDEGHENHEPWRGEVSIIPLRRSDMAMNPRGESSTPKREKYNWRPLGKQGQFQMIPKTSLYVDRAYQRSEGEVSQNKILKYAADWHWMLCGVLLVVRRPDGSYLVVDGQHRALAALTRDDISELPCLVFSLDDVTEEARTFVAAATVRTSISTVTRHKASVVAMDPVSLAVEEAAQACGCTISKSDGAGHIKAVSTLTSMVREDADIARLCLALVREMAGPSTLSGDVLAALFWLARKEPSVLGKPHSTRLIELGQDAAVIEMTRRRILVGKGGPKVDGEALVPLLNKGLRRNRIELK